MTMFSRTWRFFLDDPSLPKIINVGGSGTASKKHDFFLDQNCATVPHGIKLVYHVYTWTLKSTLYMYFVPDAPQPGILGVAFI